MQMNCTEMHVIIEYHIMPPKLQTACELLGYTVQAIYQNWTMLNGENSGTECTMEKIYLKMKFVLLTAK